MSGMSPATVSARPDALVHVLVATTAPGAALLAHGPVLDAAIARARAGGLLGRLPVSPSLGARLLSHAADVLATGRAAAEAGIAFAAAGGPPLTALTSFLAGAGDAEVAGFVAGLLGLPVDGDVVQPSRVDPDLVARIVVGLTSAQLARLAAAHPRLVGPIDGMPVHLRYAANRVLLAEAAARLDEIGLRDRADQLRDLLGPDHQILYFDPGGDGRVAEVHGDLLTATNVAVVVPGMASDITDFDWVTSGKAERILAAAGAGTAVIAWLGYDPPDGVDVIFDDDALDGAEALIRLVDGLPDDTLRTVIGHSYGSVVTGAALRQGLEVDQVVVTGSPGMLGDTAREIAGSVPIYAARAPLDSIGWTQHFGRDPSDPRFGAVRIDTGDEIAGHADYFDAGSEALDNIGLIVAGHTEQITTVEPGLLERLLNTADEVTAAGVSGRVDGIRQRAAQAVFDDAWALADGLEQIVPDPVASSIDAFQHLEGRIFEVGNGAIDMWQRMSSPDQLGDVALDSWAYARDHVDDLAEDARDLLDDLLPG